MSRVRPWEVLSETVLIDQRWLTVREQRVRLANEHEIEQFHLISAPDWASVLALTDDGDAVLVRQYRHGLAGASLELPAGVIDPGEDALTAALRELAEETGYVAREWLPLAVWSPEPARHTNRAHFFVARGAVLEGPARQEASELIDIELCPARELLDRVDAGEVRHGVHVAAILLAERRGLVDGRA